jgi:CheY-like chemotaxis protein
VDLLITDLAMAPMTGYELADVLTTAQRDLRVLYMSGTVGEEVLRYRKGASKALFLRKPFTSEALVAKVDQALHAEPKRVMTSGG